MKTKNVTEKNMKVCLVGSSGGHLTHLYMLKPFWKDKNRFWVTFDAANQIAGVDECVSLYNKEKEVLYLFYSGEIAMRQVVLELRKVLPGFMVPRKVKQVSALPKLASGKIDMTTLKEEM